MRPSSPRAAAAALLGAAITLAPTIGQACTLARLDPLRIKQLMAREIGCRLGLGQRPLPLTAITLCRGLRS